MAEQPQEIPEPADLERGRNIVDGGSLSHTVTISAELYEKLYLNPKNAVAGDFRQRFANPTPLGLFGIVVTFGSFSSVLIGWDGAAGLNALAGNFFFTGPILLLLATIFEWILGNFFAFIVTGAFAAFFLSFGVLINPTWGIAAAYSATGNAAEGAATPAYNVAIGFYFIWWGLVLFLLLVGSTRTNAVFVYVFVTLDIGVWLLVGAFFQASKGKAALAGRLQKAGGSFLFATTIGVLYLLVVIVLAELGFTIPFPVGDLSSVWARGGRRNEKKE